MVESVRAHVSDPWYLIMPDGAWMQYWDIVTLLALLFTALITPYEVCVLNEESMADSVKDPLFYVNMLVNGVFLADMIFCFVTAYREDRRDGGGWVKDVRKIRRKYLRGWFALDFISLMPFDLIAMGATGSLKDTLERLKALRPRARVARVRRVRRAALGRTAALNFGVALARAPVPDIVVQSQRALGLSVLGARPPVQCRRWSLKPPTRGFVMSHHSQNKHEPARAPPDRYNMNGTTTTGAAHDPVAAARQALPHDEGEPHLPAVGGVDGDPVLDRRPHQGDDFPSE